MVRSQPFTPPSTPAPARPAPADAIPRYVRDGRLGPERLTRDEWLLTNGLGGYAMGTVSGVPTRRYHGLLVASLAPPVERMLALHSVVESVTVEPGTPRERTVELASFRFRGGAGGVIHPRGADRLARFEKDLECRWAYRIGTGPADTVDVVKTLRLVHGRNEARLGYSVRSAGGLPVRLAVRPLVALRDHHELQSARHRGEFAAEASGPLVRVVRGLRRMDLVAEQARFRADAQWWYGFEYEIERDRGFDYSEDLFSPGAFEFPLHEQGESAYELAASVGDHGPPAADRRSIILNAVKRAAGDETDRRTIAALVTAADDFIVQRGSAGPRAGVSVIAGYPWFGDWGRDTLIALPGLFLATGRFEEARRVLETFAEHRRRGLIPNLFNDRTGEAEYNTVDASLWFLRAACAGEAASPGMLARGGAIRAACDEIIDAYRNGTDHGIRMDGDGLITAGHADSQLTWMDAKRDGTVFTPRHGKAVEINSLWHHGLRAFAAAARDERGRSIELASLAERVGASYRRLFWDNRRACCFDVLAPGPGGAWSPSPDLRPNQIFAVSLPHSPLTPEQQRGVVAIVRNRLLTPHGLRTLDPESPAYIRRYRGTMWERDAAYHNGTAWPWLLGPFAEAVMRVDGFSAASRDEARRVLSPLVARLDGESVGQLPEVFDGEDTPSHPQTPGGCMAQAWSVAETLRVWIMAAGGR